MSRHLMGLVLGLSMAIAASSGAEDCTTCHGTGSDPAPPIDTSGDAMTTATGVGAHQSHLGISTWHAEVTCSECHVVPAAIGDPGHNDTSLPAELTWGALASADGATPSWNGTSCATYCHGSTLPEGGTAPDWTVVDGSQAACGTCHGAPPAAPHPSQSDCSLCHPGMGPAMTIVDGAQHIDGTVQVSAMTCTACHGTGSDPAPPIDTSGDAMTTATGVGAHQSHLGISTWHAEVTCSECHVVPAAIGDPGHNDTALPAELTWGALASAGGATPSWNGTNCTTYCHGSTLPEGGTAPDWTVVDGSQAACGTCHGAPPAAPHPSLSDCSLCHPGMGPAMTFVDVAQHIDGTVQTSVLTCTTCHGTGSDPAPPLDTSGDAMTTATGVGAHQSHLGASTWHVEVTCSECHVVPAASGDPGHYDTSLPAELTWGALASADGATPSWNGTSCTTYCHGSTLPEGGTAPDWTVVDGSQAACGTCHGAPPATPHPQLSDCSLCHPGMGPAMTFVDGAQHIDGTVQAVIETPIITSIADVPGDQGRHVRLIWDRSFYDNVGSIYPITDYVVWRQIPPGAKKSTTNMIVVPRAMFPAGDWDYVSTVPARGEFQYNTLTPTLCDSTSEGNCLSTFFVSAITADPLVYFDSPPASGYSVDNLAPAVPANFVLAGSLLSWDESTATDFKYFSIYGSAAATRDETAVMIDHTISTLFDVAGHPYAYYHLTATDFAGNEGLATSTSSVSGVPGVAPLYNTLRNNVPNPFNPKTTIRFELASSMRVTLTVYDLSGSLVQTLVSGEHLAEGPHARDWNGTSRDGRQVSAGVYFYRLEAGKFNETKRMVLLK